MALRRQGFIPRQHGDSRVDCRTHNLVRNDRLSCLL
jgi:hypothetical protein